MMAGESAQSQYEQRRDGRRALIARRWPLILLLTAIGFGVGWLIPTLLIRMSPVELPVSFGPLRLLLGSALALSVASSLLAPSRGEVAWRRGAEGERIVGRALDDLAGDAVRVLHDRRIPRSRANIDHLVVTPAGVFTVDAKRYSGRLEVRARGQELWIKGRNRSKLLDQAQRQAEVVREILTKAGRDDAPVTPVLCFVETELPRLFAPRRLRGVVLTKPRRMAKRLLPGREPVLRQGDVVAIAKVLDAALVPAHRPGRRREPSESSVAEHARPSRSRDAAPSSPPPSTGPPGWTDASATSPPTCHCGHAMVVRTRRRDGARFYGCSTFRRCRNTAALDDR